LVTRCVTVHLRVTQIWNVCHRLPSSCSLGRWPPVLSATPANSAGDRDENGRGHDGLFARITMFASCGTADCSREFWPSGSIVTTERVGTAARSRTSVKLLELVLARARLGGSNSERNEFRSTRLPLRRSKNGVRNEAISERPMAATVSGAPGTEHDDATSGRLAVAVRHLNEVCGAPELFA
jgi:hypothetical protein